MTRHIDEKYIGYSFPSEVKNVIKLTLAFAKAVGNSQSDKEDNLVLSPYNALTALSMVAKGAGTQTREEMAQALFGASADQLDAEVVKLSAVNKDMLAANKDQVTLTTANAVWTNSELLDLNKDYAEQLKQDFDADISAEKFSDRAVPEKINNWASEKTNNLINKIVERLNADDFAVLASALYFKGDWTRQFDKNLTEDRTFTSDNDKTAVTAIMKQSFAEEGSVVYQDGADYEAIALTYGKEDYDAGKYPTMRLLLVRPKDGATSARDWLASQANGKIPAWMDANTYEEAYGSVSLPRMDIKQGHDLIPALKASGIKAAFDGSANFRKMTATGTDGLFVSQVSHDVVFKTDEKGSEAAAVTTVRMTLESMRTDPAKIDISFDRSFVFALQDIKTGLPIFIGAVNKPNNDMRPLKSGPKL